MQFSIVLIFCAISVVSAIRSITNGEGFTPVTRLEQLWRFQVGEGDSLTVGERYICLRHKEHFLQTNAYGPGVGSTHSCSKNARFEIEFVNGNKVMLKGHESQKYVSCEIDGNARAFERKTEGSVFEMTISDNGEHIILYNPSVDGILSVGNGYGIDCNGFGTGTRSQFSGWKLGPREAWQPTDEWQLIGYFDNRYSSSTTKFAYVTSIGVEMARNSEASVAVDWHDWFDPGQELDDVFIKGVSKSDIFWKTTPPNVWEPSQRLSNSIEVAPNTLTQLYQAVGEYGIFTIRTNYIKALDAQKQ